VASKHPEIVKQLNNAFDNWIAEMVDPITGGSKLWSAASETSNKARKAKTKEGRKKSRESRKKE
jgi:hypothetical protein